MAGPPLKLDITDSSGDSFEKEGKREPFWVELKLITDEDDSGKQITEATVDCFTPMGTTEYEGEGGPVIFVGGEFAQVDAVYSQFSEKYKFSDFPVVEAVIANCALSSTNEIYREIVSSQWAQSEPISPSYVPPKLKTVEDEKTQNREVKLLLVMAKSARISNCKIDTLLVFSSGCTLKNCTVRRMYLLFSEDQLRSYYRAYDTEQQFRFAKMRKLQKIARQPVVKFNSIWQGDFCVGALRFINSTVCQLYQKKLELLPATN